MRTSLTSVCVLSIVGMPYAMLGLPHQSDHAPAAGDTIGKGSSGNMEVLGGRSDGGGYPGPCAFKNGFMSVGEAYLMAPSGTMGTT